MVKTRSLLHKSVSNLENNNESIIEHLSTSKKSSKQKKQTKLVQISIIKTKLNLYEQLLQRNCKIQELSESWFKVYSKSSKQGLFTIIQLILDSSNSNYVLTEKLVKKHEPAILVDNCGDSISKESYLFSINTKEAKIFKFNFQKYFQTLTTNYIDQLLFGSDFYNELFPWLTSFANSKFRSFRHSSTVCALTISTALCKLHQQNCTAIASKPTIRKRSLQTSLNKSFSEIEEHAKKTLKTFTFLFDEIFVIRYRDVLSDIRLACLDSLQQWILINPDRFLKNDYLKYIGWLLNDHVSHVRLRALSVVFEALNNMSLTKISYFINRFKNRLLDMCFDTNDDVCVVALKLTLILYTKCISIPETKTTQIVNLVFSPSIKVSRQAAFILIEHLRDPNDESSIYEQILDFITNTPSTTHSKHKSIIKSLFGQSQLFSPKTLLLSFTKLLDNIDDSRELIALRFLYFYFKYFLSRPNKDSTNETFVTDFIVTQLSEWLIKYSLENVKIVHILKMIPFVDETCEILTDEIISNIVKSIKKILTTTNDSKVINTCAKVIELLLEKARFKIHLSSVVNSLILESLCDFVSRDEIRITQTTSRLYQLSRFIDISEFDFTPLISYTYNINPPSFNLHPLMTICFLHLCWKLTSCRHQDVPPYLLTLLQEFISKLVSIIHFYFQQPSYSPPTSFLLLLCDYSYACAKQPYYAKKDQFSDIEKCIGSYIEHSFSDGDMDETTFKSILTLSSSKLIHSMLPRLFAAFSFPSIATSFGNILAEFVRQNASLFFENLFEFLVNAHNDQDIPIVSQIICRHISITAIKKQHTSIFVDFYRKSIEHASFMLNNCFLAKLIHFRRLLKPFTHDIFQYVAIKIPTFSCDVETFLHKLDPVKTKSVKQTQQMVQPVSVSHSFIGNMDVDKSESDRKDVELQEKQNISINVSANTRKRKSSQI